jgi:hypothetical protein
MLRKLWLLEFNGRADYSEKDQEGQTQKQRQRHSSCCLPRLDDNQDDNKDCKQH